MQKALPIAIILLLITVLATPAFAAPNGKASDKAQEVHNSKSGPSENAGQGNKESRKAEVLEVSIAPSTPPVVVQQEVTPSITITTTPSVSPNAACDPNAQWKNHGQYVSCVAKQGLGGQAVSAAARSDVGKKKAQVTPSVSPSVSPTASPSVSPTITPSESPTPTDGPITSAESELAMGGNFLTDNIFVNSVKTAFDSMKKFIASLGKPQKDK
jgi:hypothetical protein